MLATQGSLITSKTRFLTFCFAIISMYLLPSLCPCTSKKEEEQRTKDTVAFLKATSTRLPFKSHWSELHYKTTLTARKSGEQSFFASK